jgi:hypothetical protein
MSERVTLAGRLLRIFCATLMLSLGFAHRPVQAAAPAPAFDEAYRLPDGSFAEICFGHGDVKNATQNQNPPGHHETAVSLFCEACLLSSSILVPAPDTSSWLRTSFVSLENNVSITRSTIGKLEITRPRARAPPVSV